MEKVLVYLAVFAAGVVADELFGASIVGNVKASLKETEANVVAALKAEISKLTGKL